ncbi:MAG: FtsX-like permease family protein [Planctomycetota bacterium]|nr:FtsX-like permease family protein [Planctomycetota bacterium]MDA1178410.1 FtsX-like permease family protein [Planctomycetota bacterium]
MSIVRLICKELLFSKLTSLLMLLAVSTAAAYVVTTVTMLKIKQQQLVTRVVAMDDEIRKITKDMGFNINILPRDQNLTDFYSQDFADKTMPYEFVQRLADSNIATIQHLRPALIRKIDWPEYNRQIILMGVHGVVPWTHRKSPQPLSEPVPTGTMVLGYQLARELKLPAGTVTRLQGRELSIGKVLPARGDKDDITVFIDLETAQQMLNLPGQVNLIQALECNCASIDRVGEIEAEIATVLGSDVQVLELSTKAIARARARTEVESAGKRHLASSQRNATIYSLLAIVTACLLTASLFLLNVRQRQGEIATWRALGLSKTKIMLLFQGKALLLGLLGSALGYACGTYLGWRSHEVAATESALPLAEAVISGVAWAVFALTPLLTVIASWIPAVVAASQQPALVLARE